MQSVISIINAKGLLYYLIVVIALYFSSCGIPYETTIHSSQFKDQTLVEVLKNIEKNQDDSNLFAELGRNGYSNIINIMILATAIFTSIIAIIEGSKIWRKSSKGRLVILLVLSIFATITSSTGLYMKSESDRFFKEDRDKYIALSLNMNDVITEFYLTSREIGVYDDGSIQDSTIKKQLIDLSRRTLKQLSDLRKDYNEKYNLNTN